MKIVINKCYGGFSLSEEAYKYLGIPWDGYGFKYDDKRTDPKLVECVETLGNAASGVYAQLRVVEIPDGIDWEIGDYDGVEWIAEKHEIWE